MIHSWAIYIFSRDELGSPFIFTISFIASKQSFIFMHTEAAIIKCTSIKRKKGEIKNCIVAVACQWNFSRGVKKAHTKINKKVWMDFEDEALFNCIEIISKYIFAFSQMCLSSFILCDLFCASKSSIM